MPRTSWRSSRSRLPTTCGRLRRDHVLELVDLVVEVVDEIEEALGDVVDQVVGVHPDLLVRPAGLLRRLGVERLLAGRSLGDGDEDVRRRDEVDLLVVDAVLVRDGDRHEEDAEHVAALGGDARPWLVVVHVRREQRLEGRRMHLLRQGLVQLRGRRVDQVDPLGHDPRLASASAGPALRGAY